MSGKQSDGSFDLTHSKATYYLRRPLAEVPPGVESVAHFLEAAGLHFVTTSWGGWKVQATQGEIWTALSGMPAAVGHHPG